MSYNLPLINPGISERSQNQKNNAIVNITFPTSLGVLAGYVGASGISTRIVGESIKGNVLIENNWENFGVQYMWESDHIPYVPGGTDRLELIFDTMWANVSYYLRPRGIKKLLSVSGRAIRAFRLEVWRSFLSKEAMIELFMCIPQNTVHD